MGSGGIKGGIYGVRGGVRGGGIGRGAGSKGVGILSGGGTVVLDPTKALRRVLARVPPPLQWDELWARHWPSPELETPHYIRGHACRLSVGTGGEDVVAWVAGGGHPCQGGECRTDETHRRA